MYNSFTVIGTGSNVEKGYFVGAFFIITPRNLNRVAGIADINKFYALTTRPLSTSRQGIIRLANAIIKLLFRTIQKMSFHRGTNNRVFVFLVDFALHHQKNIFSLLNNLL